MADEVPSLNKAGDMKTWARQMYEYLSNQSLLTKAVTAEPILLARQTSNARAGVDGIVLFNPTLRVPVFSRDGNYLPLTTAGAEYSIDTAYNVDGPDLPMGETAVADFALEAGTYRLSGFVSVATTGLVAANAVFYIADTSDLTTPLSSAISGSIGMPAVAGSVQVPIRGDLVAPTTSSYSLVARTSANSLYAGKAHGVAGLNNNHMTIEISRVQ